MSAIATDAIEYSSFMSAIDLYAAKGRDIQYLEIVTATTGATITGKTKGSGTTARTYNVVQGTRIDFAMRTIDSVNAITLVRVAWADF